MKIPVWIEFSQEVGVDIGKDEIFAAFTSTPDPGESWLTVLNRFALCLNVLPDNVIATFTSSQRLSIVEFLTRHAERIAPNGVAP